MRKAGGQTRTTMVGAEGMCEGVVLWLAVDLIAITKSYFWTSQST